MADINFYAVCGWGETGEYHNETTLMMTIKRWAFDVIFL